MGAGRLGPLQLLAGVAAAALLVALGSGQLGHRRKTTAVLTRDHDVVHVQTSGAASTVDGVPDQGVATRVLVEDSEWGRAAERALSEWRASLFGRMAMQYKELERNKSESGTKTIEREEPFQQSRFDLFDPFLNCSSSQLKRLGNKGDGGKWICLDTYLQQPGCIIYSLGSRGWYDFEEAMLEATPCEIHTFDCTFDGSALPNSGGRHHYHKICVGQPSSAFAKATPDMFKTYQQIMESLGHTRVDLLKIDIEGFEYDVLHEWKPTCQLPMQISMEVLVPAQALLGRACSVVWPFCGLGLWRGQQGGESSMGDWLLCGVHFYQG